ncbi:DNA double-strand break repair nuclease NurA [Deinococcus taeanensis]|uniref:DNA double-strand break repair nuclease NurA n=1 Tax=Deinococcus taeanensis TaxID=2737050 RepID=UPI001CDC0327|nr:DNA double-strand break repair nuclease NurA [Deinococcus taeanensis]UBV43896.1 DNA double-strand break repair nuclease NurA [Deinococcus taeanensis]
MARMRIRLDPWPVDLEGGQLTLAPFQGDLIDIETPRWAAIPARPLPQGLRRVYVVDGKRRMESRVFLEDAHGSAGMGGFGAFVVGAVSLCPHGTRPAELLDVRAQRVLAHAPDLLVNPTQLSPRDPHTGQLLYTPVATEGSDPLAPLHRLQALMLNAEQDLSHAYASSVPFDETDDTEPLTALTLQDGTLRRGGATLGGAVVGYVKTMQTQYLPPDRVGLLSGLKPGERTPILHMKSETGRSTRFTWYVRLCEAAFYQHPMSGVMRLEMYAPPEPDFLPRTVREVANLSGTLLCRLGSAPHKDPRAPQNLIPTAALEQAMTRAMGSADLITRRIRAHIAAAYGQEAVA